MAGSRQGVTGGQLENVLITKQLKMAVMTFVLPADNYQLTKDHPTVLNIDPDGAKDVLLPAIDAETRNLVFIIKNWAGGAEDITIKTSADAALSPSIVISQNEMALLMNDGVTWFGCMLGANT